MTFRVEGPRLYVRPWQPMDREIFVRCFAEDPEMLRYISFGRPWEPSKTDAYFERQRGFLARHGCCVGAVVLKSTDEVVGGAGIQPQDLSGDFEFAWSIWRAHWGKGYATEAAAALKSYAFEVMALPRIVAIADVPNLASIRIMQKIGMRFDRVVNAKELAARYPDVQVARYIADNPRA